MSEPDYLLANRAVWTTSNAEYTDGQALAGWQKDEITWGIWNAPERDLDVLGRRELRPRSLGVRRIDLVMSMPTGRAPRFASHAEKYAVPQPSSITSRPATPFVILCSPDTGAAEERLIRPQFGMRRFEWPGEERIEFHLGHGAMLGVLRSSGFDVEALHELYAPETAETHQYYDFVTADWARKWPSEEI